MGHEGVVPQRLYAQAHQQVRQSGHVSGAGELAESTELRPGQHPDRKGGQEPGAGFSGHNERLAGRRQLGRQRRREKPVGDAHPAATGPVPRLPAPKGHPGDHGFDAGGDFGRQGRVPPEIAGGPPCAESEPARPEHLYTRSERFHCSQGRLPAADLGRHVPGHHLEVRATALHLPPAHTRPGTGGPGGR